MTEILATPNLPGIVIALLFVGISWGRIETQLKHLKERLDVHVEIDNENRKLASDLKDELGKLNTNITALAVGVDALASRVGNLELRQ